MSPEIDMRALRALLAGERITHLRYAAACGMSRRYVSRLLVGADVPGELATIKLHRGLDRLGLGLAEREATRA